MNDARTMAVQGPIYCEYPNNAKYQLGNGELLLVACQNAGSSPAMIQLKRREPEGEKQWNLKGNNNEYTQRREGQVMGEGDACSPLRDGQKAGKGNYDNYQGTKGQITLHRQTYYVPSGR